MNTTHPPTPSVDDTAATLNLLRRRFPAVTLWFGRSTRHWWALVGDRLIEAKTPEELGRALDYVHHTPHPSRRWESLSARSSGSGSFPNHPSAANSAPAGKPHLVRH